MGKKALNNINQEGNCGEIEWTRNDRSGQKVTRDLHL